MKKSLISLVGILLCVFVAMPQRGISQDSAAGSGGKLEVHVKYDGAGTVDEKHKVYVLLWDSADFMSGGQTPPVAVLTTATKGGTVTFSDVKKSPAYVSAVFDVKGEWDPQTGPPPNGSPLGLYMKTPGQAEPIEIKAGKTVSVELGFDDSFKMGG